MKILGVDPGLVNTGFGIISYNKVIEILDFGIISPDKNSLNDIKMKYNILFNKNDLKFLSFQSF